MTLNNVLNLDNLPKRFHHFGKVETTALTFFFFFAGSIINSSNFYILLFLKTMSLF